MNICYLRFKELHNSNPGKAMVIDAFLRSRMMEGAKISTHTVADHREFGNGTKYLIPKTESKELMLIGTIPYHLLVANLYRLEEDGYAVFIDPTFILTDIEDPLYPQEYVKTWEEYYGLLNGLQKSEECAG